jgi:cAMP-dependent protein kinase regulator
MIQQRKNKVAGRGQRSSVSAEVYGMFNQKAEFKARVIPKTPDKKSRIVNKVMQSFLFNSLEEKELNTE